jgi:hypothetical protein
VVVSAASEEALVFSPRISAALFVAWDLEHALMMVHRWSPRGGYNHTTRNYP